MDIMRRIRTVAMGLLVLCGAIATPVAAAPITITVDNNAARGIDGLYLSLYADRGWGPDQLNGTPVASGATVVVSNVDCTSGSIVVIAEDEAGCFLYRTVSCGGDASWTITNSTARDCGR
jgi:hypothetical protein